jgi:hypothetical protein
VLDDESNNHISSEKPNKVSPKVTNIMLVKRVASTILTTTHQSWAEVVKSKPPDGSDRRLKRLKRWSLILSV